MTSRIVIGITGASGATYARRVMELLAEAGVEMHLAVSGLGRRLLFDELDMKRVDPDALTGGHGGLVTVYNDNDVGAAIASGSFVHDGMVIVPCSANTLGAIAAGLGDNLVKRAAAVALKERRQLILGYREMPASHIDVCTRQLCGGAHRRPAWGRARAGHALGRARCRRQGHGPQAASSRRKSVIPTSSSPSRSAG
jgi:polyprenyl P-hydroxybenzoate/phenylacrylic acid decarboxylase-like protein